MQKEIYFTKKTIQEKSKEFLASVEQSRQRHSDVTFKPNKAALLVLDMQEYFMQESSHAFIPSAPAILPGVVELLAAFSRMGRPVIKTRHINTSEDAGLMSRWWRDLIHPQTSYSHYINNIKTTKTHSLTKTQYDAFHKTSLEEELRKLDVNQVVICGVMTHLCCETTARSAFMRGFEVFFTIDGTATYNESLHRATLLTLAHGFAVPILIEELLQAIKNNET